MSRSGRDGVSVVIPAYNGEKYIAEALRSVFEQRRLPDEVIVVDDASTDDTPCRVETLAGEAPIPLRLIRLPSNSGGPASPTNVGIRAAQSPLIAVLDQDDVFLPHRIERQCSILEEHPQVSFVVGFYKTHGKSDSQVDRAPGKGGRGLLRRRGGYESFVLVDGSVALRSFIVHGNFAGGFPAFTFRRVGWRRMGGLDEDLAAAADYDILCFLCREGPVALVPEVHYLRRVHEGNLSHRRVRCRIDLIRTLAKYAHCKDWPTAARDVRGAIAKNLYHLAVLLSAAGHADLARRLLTGSLLVGGMRPANLVRHLKYTLNVGRRRKRNRYCEVSEKEAVLAAASLDAALDLYGRRWWRWVIPEPWKRSAA